MSCKGEEPLLLGIRTAQERRLQSKPLDSSVLLGCLESHDTVDTHRIHLVLLSLDQQTDSITGILYLIS